MTKAEFEAEVVKITAVIEEFEEDNEKIGDLFGRDAIAENVFLTHIYTAIDLSIDYLAKLVGDTGEWLIWYFYECSAGKKPMSASIDGVKKPSRTASDLWDIIKAHAEA